MTLILLRSDQLRRQELAAGDADGIVRFWDLATRQPTGLPLIDGQGGSIESVAFSPDGKTLASGSYDLTVRLGGGPRV